MEKKYKRKSRPNPVNSQIAYTPAKPFNKGRLLLHLATVGAIVLALLFTMNIFFKVGKEKVKVEGALEGTGSAAQAVYEYMPKVYVSGNDIYTQEQIVEASGVRAGDNLLGLSKAQISGRIIQALRYVDTVRIRLVLPDRVYLVITELDVTYAIEDSAGAMWLISSSGRVIEKIPNADAADHTRILGVTLQDPQVGQAAVAAQSAASEPGVTGETVPVVVYGSERLEAAKAICHELEQAGMLGTVTSIDVSLLTDVKMNYQDQYEILMGDTSQLAKKVQNIKSTIDQLGKADAGTLDVSFTIRPQEVVYTPYQDEN